MPRSKSEGNLGFKPRLMRAKQAAVYLSISEAWIWKLVKQGKLPKPVKLGDNCSLFEVKWLDDYADKVMSGEA